MCATAYSTVHLRLWERLGSLANCRPANAGALELIELPLGLLLQLCKAFALRVLQRAKVQVRLGLRHGEGRAWPSSSSARLRAALCCALGKTLRRARSEPR
eukprot:6199934-Pleurochrysis_carterae.AAC.1